MSEKKFDTRIINKHDTEANWKTAGNRGFAPKAAELIIYDKDATHNYIRYKIGDGSTKVHELPFMTPIRTGEGENSTIENCGDIVRVKGWECFYNSDSSFDGYNPDQIEFNIYNSDSLLALRKEVGVQSLNTGAVLYGTITNIQDSTYTIKLLSCPSWIGRPQDDIAPSHTYVIFLTKNPAAGNIETNLIAYGAHAEGGGIEYTNGGTLSYQKGGTALGNGAHAEGSDTFAFGEVSHAEGGDTYAFGTASHAEGYRTKAYGVDSHAEGIDSISQGYYSHAEGENTCASGRGSHAEGLSTKSKANYSHTEGSGTEASSGSAHAEGCGTKASGNGSHAEGQFTEASNDWTHAEGWDSIASGHTSHAEGKHTVASGKFSHAENNFTTASGKASHAEGSDTEAAGDFSHAGGLKSRTSGKNGFVHGENLISSKDNQTVFGKNNISDGKANLIIGNGKNDTSNRSNAFTVYDDSIKINETEVKEKDFINMPKFFSSSDCVFNNDRIFSYTFNGPDTKQIQLSKFDISYVDFSPITGSNTALTLMINQIEVNSKSYRLDVFDTKANIKPDNGVVSYVDYANGYIKFENSRAKLYINSWILYGDFQHTAPDYSLIFKDYEEGLYETEGWIYTHGDAVVVGRTSGYYVEDITELLSSDIAKGLINITQGSTIKLYTSIPISEFDSPFDYIEMPIQLPEFTIQYSGIKNSIGGKGEGEWAEWFNAAELASGKYSHAEGYKTRAEGIGAHAEGAGVVTAADGTKTINPGGIAVGNGAHAEGSNTQALKEVSHAEGGGTLADGVGSHAEGVSTKALGNGSHAEGGSTTAEGTGSHAEGGSTYAKGYRSHAEGDSTKAIGNNTHAEGYYTYAEGNYSHSEGYVTRSIGNYSHTEGQNDLAFGETAHAEGRANIASGIGAHSEGGAGESIVEMRFVDTSATAAEVVDTSTNVFDWLKEGFHFYIKENEGTAGPANKVYKVTFADKDTNWIEFNEALDVPVSETSFTGVFYSNHALGNFSHAEGSRTIAQGAQSHSEGQSTIAFGTSSHAEGNMTWAWGDNSHAEGWDTGAEGKYAHAEGRGSLAYATGAHAEGYYTDASGDYSHAEGSNTYTGAVYAHAEGYESRATKAQAHAEGFQTQATNINTHAEGKSTKATAPQAHAEGNETQASGDNSHAEGWKTIASGKCSHAAGRETQATADYQYVIGKFSIQNNNAAFIIGNGTGPTKKNNLLEIGEDSSTKKPFIKLSNEGLTSAEILALWS